MTEWRFGRGWTDAELAARLQAARARTRNFDLTEGLTPGRGWNRHASEAIVAREIPGPPVSDGAFERAWTLLQRYAFSDPRIVRSHFDSSVPLLDRRMLLEIQVLGLRYLGGVMVGAVQDEHDEQRSLRGYRYDTIEGHIERGCEWFLLRKDHATGEITFHIRAAWQPGDFPNAWSRLGFSLLARRYQRAWHRLAHLRMRAMLGSHGLPPLPYGRRLVHEGPELGIGPVQIVAGMKPSEITAERDEPGAPGPPQGASGSQGAAGAAGATRTEGRGFSLGRRTGQGESVMDDMLTAAALGVITGGRSMLGAALGTQLVVDRPHPAWLDRAAQVVPLLAAGEIVADKTPLIPARIDALPLLGRLAIGALTGAAVVPQERRFAGAALGAAGAAAGALAFYELRRRLISRGVPNVMAGLSEDALLMAAGLSVLQGERR